MGPGRYSPPKSHVHHKDANPWSPRRRTRFNELRRMSRTARSACRTVGLRVSQTPTARSTRITSLRLRSTSHTIISCAAIRRSAARGHGRGRDEDHVEHGRAPGRVAGVAGGVVSGRMGRPPLPDGDARDVVFTLRLTAAEKRALEMAAQAAGRPATRWAQMYSCRPLREHRKQRRSNDAPSTIERNY